MSYKARAKVSSLFFMALQELARLSLQRAFPNFLNAHCTWCRLVNLELILEHSRPSFRRFLISHTHGVQFFSSTKPTYSSRNAQSKIYIETPSSPSSCVSWNTSRVFYS